MHTWNNFITSQMKDAGGEFSPALPILFQSRQTFTVQLEKVVGERLYSLLYGSS